MISSLRVEATLSEPTDEELARRVIAGDAQALQVLHDRYGALLRARARRALRGPLGRRLGASDVMQEAWISVVLRLDGFEDRGPGSFRAWLLKVFDHKLDDAVRKHVTARRRAVDRERSNPDVAAEATVPARDPTPSDSAARRNEMDRVLAAMDGLAPAYQEVLRLVHFQGLTLAEAGSILGRTPNATCKIYGRALARLRERLGAAPQPQ